MKAVRLLRITAAGALVAAVAGCASSGGSDADSDIKSDLLTGPNACGLSNGKEATGAPIKVGAMVGAPRLVLLNEPGAGLAEADAKRLVPLIHALADPPDTVVMLVDHDMDLVQDVCRDLAVLDFGRLIAHGPTAAVLEDAVVKRAYLGTEDVG